MKLLNIEIKARTADQGRIRNIFSGLEAEYRGLDHQVDTYFNASKGRLKLREGNIENNLIYYERENMKGPKESRYDLLKTEPGSMIKNMLSSAMGVFKVVEKKREIYYIDNVKFHIDTVQNLGNFIEIEAIDNTGGTDSSALLEQCRHYLDLFGVKEEDLLTCSYSDLLE